MYVTFVAGLPAAAVREDHRGEGTAAGRRPRVELQAVLRVEDDVLAETRLVRLVVGALRADPLAQPGHHPVLPAPLGREPVLRAVDRAVDDMDVAPLANRQERGAEVARHVGRSVGVA